MRSGGATGLTFNVVTVNGSIWQERRRLFTVTPCDSDHSSNPAVRGEQPRSRSGEISVPWNPGDIKPVVGAVPSDNISGIDCSSARNRVGFETGTVRPAGGKKMSTRASQNDPNVR